MRQKTPVHSKKTYDIWKIEEIEKRREEYVELYLKNACNATATAKAIGVKRGTWYGWLDKDATFKNLILDAERSLVDYAETQLWKNIQTGKERSLELFLTNRAPDRWKSKIQGDGDTNIINCIHLDTYDTTNKK